MTAREKFEARLKELWLLNEWEVSSDTRIAMFDEDQSIILFVHESDDDKYSEIHFPPYAELRENEEFRKECWNEFCDHDDANFVSDLALWLTKKTDKCPLFPVDVYFPGFGSRTYYHNFEDDKDEPIDLELDKDEEYQTMIAENRGQIDLIMAQLDLFRHELVDMIRCERQRGHNIPMHFDPYPGWGSLSFYGYNVGGKTFGIDILGDGSPAIVLYEPGEDNITISLSASDFPIEVLFNIYNEMK